MIGAADPLRKTRSALWRADMDDEIDIAPVDAEVERRSGDNGPQFVGGHGGFHLAALGDVERTVMQRDRQIFLVHRPEFLEKHFGLPARIDEKQRRPVFGQLLVDIRNGVFGGMTGPRDVLVCREDRDFRLGAAFDGHETGVTFPALFLRNQPFLQVHGFGDGGGQTDCPEAGRELTQAGKAEGQHVAAFRGDQRMQFVKDDVFQVLEEAFRFIVGEQQRHLLRRRQQDIGRVQLLALALGMRRVAGAVLDGNGQAHLRDRLHQVPLDIDRKRLQWRDIEGVNAGEGGARRDLAAAGEVGQRREKAGERFAGAGRRDQQRAFAAFGAGQQFQLMGAGPPALFREPADEGGGQGGGAGFEIGLVHRANVVQMRWMRSHCICARCPTFEWTLTQERNGIDRSS